MTEIFNRLKLAGRALLKGQPPLKPRRLVPAITPEEVAEVEESYTGQFLRKALSSLGSRV